MQTHQKLLLKHKSNSFFLGTIVKKHGTNDGFVLKHNSNIRSEQLNKLESILLDIQNHEVLVPFFVDKVIPLNNNSTVFYFKDTLPSWNNLLIKADAYTDKQITKKQINHFTFETLVGFVCIDEKKGNIGHVNAILEYPQQILLEITHNTTNYLVPLNEAFVRNIDTHSQTIYLDCPEGLLDIYSNKT